MTERSTGPSGGQPQWMQARERGNAFWLAVMSGLSLRLGRTAPGRRCTALRCISVFKRCRDGHPAEYLAVAQAVRHGWECYRHIRHLPRRCMIGFTC